MKQRLVNGEHLIWVVDSIADWDAPDSWEKIRLSSMQQHLTPDDMLFDIGVEHGWLSAIYAKFVSPENMVLFEPSPEFWVNIRKTWQANGYPNPKSFFVGFASDRTLDLEMDIDTAPFGGFPRFCWDTEDECPAMAYRSLRHHTSLIPSVTIDEFVARTEIVPTALTIDCEGAELKILMGALGTLIRENLKVWVSIHPDLMERDFNQSDKDIHILMKSAGYSGFHLATDHEAHWLFTKDSK